MKEPVFTLEKQCAIRIDAYTTLDGNPFRQPAPEKLMKRQIKTIQLTICVLIFLSVASVNSYVYAEDKARAAGKAFLGINYANHDIDMDTAFTRRTNGAVTERSEFKNSYTTDAGGLFVGYALPYKKIILSGQVFYNIYNDDFRLSVGSSKITNAVNHAFGIELMPGFYLMDGLSVFGKLGVVSGDFDFVKSSPTSTQYNVSSHLNGYMVGFGLAFDISPQFTAKVGYSQTRYEEIEIDATLGSRHDKTVVEPRGESVFLTLQYNFY